MSDVDLSPEEIERWEFHYFNEICFLLEQDREKMLNGLNSKEEIKQNWIEVFQSTSQNLSDFSRGAERIYYWLFNQFGKPNSAPIGSDLMFETYNAYVHIDIKTATISNKSDYFNKINIGKNQTSYVCENCNGNLPPYYTKKEQEKKYCCTYAILVVFDNESLNIVAVIVTCIPNGILRNIYTSEIVQAGKNKEKSFRFIYNCKFRLIKNKPKRYMFLFLHDSYEEKDFLDVI